MSIAMMGGFLGVLAPALTPALAQADEAFCSSPWEQLCVSTVNSPREAQKNVNVVRAEIRAEALALAERPEKEGGCGSVPRAEMITAYRQMGHPLDEARRLATLDKMHDVGNYAMPLCYAKIVERKVFERLGSTITRSWIAQIFERARAALIAEVHAQLDPMPEKHAVRDQMIAAIGRVQFLFSDRYWEWAELNRDRSNPNSVTSLAVITNSDAGMCGTDMVRRNLFASSTGYIPRNGHPVHTGMLAVVGCPGQWLDLLTVRSGLVASNLYQVFGHEIAHHIHVNWNRAALGHIDPEGRPLDYKTVPAYEHMIPCLQRDYEGLFPKVSDSTVSAYRETYAKVLEREPTAIDYKSNEVASDYWGTRVMARLLREDAGSGANALSGAMNGLRRLCFANTNLDLSTAHSDTHPSGKFRIEIALKEPALRTALGCSATGSVGSLGSRPACEVSPPNRWEFARR